MSVCIGNSLKLAPLMHEAGFTLLRRRRRFTSASTPSLSIRSSESRERVTLQFTVRPLGGQGCDLVLFHRVSCRILWFSSGQAVNHDSRVAANILGEGAHWFSATNVVTPNVEDIRWGVLSSSALKVENRWIYDASLPFLSVSRLNWPTFSPHILSPGTAISPKTKNNHSPWQRPHHAMIVWLNFSCGNIRYKVLDGALRKENRKWFVGLLRLQRLAWMLQQCFL